ncbi:PLP-dependent aminotransferase family protein [Cohnella sp. GbtcB17]|uniref:aminotransferase-like domain-containing protein n=1 Tax=Cohnella sp. GbtcB17 TaxID=2824762 RepID=UPI001C304B27|nr:PLP-dependent aminotransferase family protein [Cohnella sp. GbtcB17]
MSWQPDRSLDKPVYRQIAEHFEQRIQSGELTAGSPLPAERKLAAQLAVNRTTVIQAYEELRASGWVVSKIGSGTVVAGGDASPLRPADWRKYLDVGTMLPNSDAMRRIRSGLRKENGLVDFASGELSDELFPGETVRGIFSERPYDGPLGYDDPQGYGPFREALAAFLSRHLHIRASASSLLITSGSQQSLFLIMQCLLNHGDAVGVETPSYCFSLPLLQSAGLRVYPLPVGPEGIDPTDVERLHRRHRLKMLFLNPNFQNPTGTVLSAERRAALLRIAEKEGIPIVEDDPFSLTAFDGRPPLPLKAEDAGGRILYVGSLSKIAASGLRVGWLAGPQEIVSRLADARQQMDFGMSVIPQWLAAKLIEGAAFDSQIGRLRDRLALRLDELRASLDYHLPGLVTFEPPGGGLNLWVKWLGDSDPRQLRVLERAMSAGVAYVPGQVFGAEEPSLRLCYAKPQAGQIELGVIRLKEALLRS